MNHLLQIKSTSRDFTIHTIAAGTIHLFYGNNRLSTQQLTAIKNHPCGFLDGAFEFSYSLIDCPKGGDFENIESIKDESLAVNETRNSVRAHIETNLAFLTAKDMLTSTSQLQIALMFRSSSFRNFCIDYTNNQEKALATW